MSSAQFIKHLFLILMTHDLSNFNTQGFTTLNLPENKTLVRNLFLIRNTMFCIFFTNVIIFHHYKLLFTSLPRKITIFFPITQISERFCGKIGIFIANFVEKHKKST